jgi:ferredoxin-NADP reductase
MAGTALLGRLRAPIRWRVATVREVRIETPHASTLVLDVADWPAHLPGQHVDVRLTSDDGYQAQRSYSIASAPEQAALELTVERIEGGEVSAYLTDDVRTGDQFEIRGPIGGYFTWTAADGGPLLLIGGGSGMVPLMSMLRHRQAARSTADTRLLLSARAWDDVLYRDELARIEAAGVAVHRTLTRDRPAGWGGWSRRVDTAMLREVGPTPDQTPRTFVCGPTPFVETVADLLVQLGHAPGTVRTERFGPTGG